MGSLIVVFAVLAIVVGWFGFHRSGAVRTLARLVLFALFAVFAATTVFCLYATVAWSSKGGGVLFLVAMPAGLLSFVFFSMLTASTQHEAYFGMSVDGKIDYNLGQIEDLEAQFQQTIDDNTRKLGRFWLGPGKRKELKQAVAHARFMLQRLAQMKTRVSDKAIYRGDQR
jgi:hypothetical protein